MAERVLFELPDVAPAGEKGYVNFVPAKLTVLIECLRYNIGKHANQSADTGRGDMNVYPKYPIGTDPHAMDRLIEDEIARRGLGPARPQQVGPVKGRGKIFNDALLKAVGHKEAPAEVKAAMKTEDGDELEIVEEPLPEQFDPERQGEQE